MSEIKKGSKVAYSATFLRNTGQYTGAMPFARGVVTHIENSGGKPWLATIKWTNDYDDEIPKKVNVANLVLVDRIPFEARNPGHKGGKFGLYRGEQHLYITQEGGTLFVPTNSARNDINQTDYSKEDWEVGRIAVRDLNEIRKSKVVTVDDVKKAIASAMKKVWISRENPQKGPLPGSPYHIRYWEDRRKALGGNVQYRVIGRVFDSYNEAYEWASQKLLNDEDAGLPYRPLKIEEKVANGRWKHAGTIGSLDRIGRGLRHNKGCGCMNPKTKRKVKYTRKRKLARRKNPTVSMSKLMSAWQRAKSFKGSKNLAKKLQPRLGLRYSFLLGRKGSRRK